MTKNEDLKEAPYRIWLLEDVGLLEDDDHRIIWSADDDCAEIHPEYYVLGEYTLSTRPEPQVSDAEALRYLDSLRKTAKSSKFADGNEDRYAETIRNALTRPKAEVDVEELEDLIRMIDTCIKSSVVPSNAVLKTAKSLRHTQGLLGGVPEGYVMVPVEPKSSQVADAMDIFNLEGSSTKVFERDGFEHTLVRFYKAMIAAAPEPKDV